MHHHKIGFQFFKRASSKLHFFRFFSSQPSHFENVGPLVSQLKSRSVIRIRGPDTVKFLQGMLTNDVRSFEEPCQEKASTLPTSNLPTVSTPPIYAAMLTPQGRFLYDFFLYRSSRQDENFDKSGSGPGPKTEALEVFADVDGSVVDELLDTLKKYRLRSKVDIDNVGEEFYCWQRYEGKLPQRSSSVEEPEAPAVGWAGGVDCPAESSTCRNENGWQWFKDPRLDCLGFRGIFPSNSLPPLVEADKETDEQNFLLWRVENGVAEGSAEIPKGEAMPLEYNLAGLNAISFDKGCYVGQELVARTQHRGVIRKRLLPLKFVDDSGKEVEQRVAPGSVVIDPASSKKAGTVTTALGSRGLGLLRLEQAFKGSRRLALRGNEVKIEVIRPEWWPPEWFLDHESHSAAAEEYL